MNMKKEKLFMVITLVLCMLLFLQRWMGEIWHAVLGMILMIMAVVHVCRQIARLKYKKFSIQLVDWVLMASLVVLFLTGMLLHPLQGVLVVKILHKFSAILFALGIVGHVVQHMREKGKG